MSWARNPAHNATITQSYKDSSADIDKVALEGITQIIVGEKSVDYYDQVLAELQTLGLDKVVADVNATFQSAK
jgi:hypothetical protein